MKVYKHIAVILDQAYLLKVWSDRLSWYLGKISQLMVVYLFFDKIGWSWWYLLIFFGIVGVVWLEKNKIIKQEQEYYVRHNTFLQELIKAK
jgi:hypothetical protein